jgi:hypothetical protein
VTKWQARGGESLSPVEVDLVLDDEPCSEAVDAGDAPVHVGAAVPPARRDLNDLDHTRAGIDEFLDLKGRRPGRKLADVAAEPLVAS